ncbi:protein KINESIN LIGHT CHAIN-RELATED 1-like [Hibiscus syriacus]|uniref:protein KINESIN LIGHT CHAIN-RELATED 1-like n=1 Tax=Hibiscus syriacus TaxID=106335 RepID=UPI0019233DA1|nr:protein KINESIN LIGHT CHAIN-RELATED 1-like [Hibiscus syriacus]
MSFHILAVIYTSLRRFEEAVLILELSIEVPVFRNGSDHALAKFSGCMHLGDKYSILGQLDQSIKFYDSVWRIQIEAHGDLDARVAETCRYLAEANVQATQFDEAENLCRKALEIHNEHCALTSLEDVADHQLMALVYEAKADYESALEHLVLASMSKIADNQANESANDIRIGNIYSSLCRFDEAIFAYQKALTVFKSIKGKNHPSVDCRISLYSSY